VLIGLLSLRGVGLDGSRVGAPSPARRRAGGEPGR
jgi:hypothetical protein